MKPRGGLLVLALAAGAGCKSNGNSGSDGGSQVDGGCQVPGGCITCTADPQCPPRLARCNPASGLCVACLSDADCGDGGATRCDPSSHHCGACVSASDCPYDKPGCSSGTCGTCAVDGDCPAGMRCDETRTCRCFGASGCGGDAPSCIGTTGDAGEIGNCGCRSAADCGAGQVCDATNFTFGACVTACTAQGGVCAVVNPGSACDADSGVCLQCLSNTDCADGGAAPTCLQGKCRLCLNDAECAAIDPSRPRCTEVLGCVACLGWQDCSPATPGCNAVTDRCGSCAGAGDCPPGLGCGANRCVPLCGGAGADAGCPLCSPAQPCGDAGQCNFDAGVCG